MSYNILPIFFNPILLYIIHKIIYKIYGVYSQPLPFLLHSFANLYLFALLT